MDFWGCFFAFLAALSSAFAVSKAGLIAKETGSATEKLREVAGELRNSLAIDVKAARQGFVKELGIVGQGIMTELIAAARERAAAKQTTEGLVKSVADLAANKPRSDSKHD